MVLPVVARNTIPLGCGRDAMRMIAGDKEQEIIELFRRGDASAMDVLYAEYAGRLTGVCARYVASDDDLKDVMQEALIKIFTRIGGFEYQGKGSLLAWMARIVVNESLQLLKRRRRLQTVALEEDLAGEMPQGDDTSPQGVSQLSGDELTAIIRKLPAGYRSVFCLYAIEGKSHKEIAAMLGIRPDSSASQYHRAKSMLAKMIKDYTANRNG